MHGGLSVIFSCYYLARSQYVYIGLLCILVWWVDMTDRSVGRQWDGTSSRRHCVTWNGSKWPPSALSISRWSRFLSIFLLVECTHTHTHADGRAMVSRKPDRCFLRFHLLPSPATSMHSPPPVHIHPSFLSVCLSVCPPLSSFGRLTTHFRCH